MEAKAKILGIIPARYGSTRFPGKPLAMIHGKTMIQRVWEQAFKAKSLFDVIVATDNEEIYKTVTDFGGMSSMTASYETGTDRCAELLSFQEEGFFDYVINIQGDQPIIQPEQIDLLAQACDGETEIATLVKYEPQKWRSSLNTVKAYVKNGEALSFSRTNENYPFKHIGIYAYRTDILAKIAKLPITALEKATSLEQLRWITNGFKIKCIETTLDSPSIDTPEDLCELLKTLK